MVGEEAVPKVGPEQMEQLGDAEVTDGNSLTVMVKVVVEAHCPGVGVNVYVVVVVLLSAGDQDPVMPLREVVGKAPKAAPEHIGPTALKVGTVVAGVTFIVTVSVAVQPTPLFAFNV